MFNIYILRNIKNRGYQFNNIYKSEFEKVLCNNIKIASNITNKYKDLQNIYLE